MRGMIVAVLALAALAWAQAPAAQAKDLKGWGVVVLPGKGGNPSQMAPVVAALKAAGAAVLSPAVSWGKTYRTYEQTLDEIGGHVAALKKQGVGRVAIVGQSLGANVALGYGAQRGDVAAVVAMAPGHRPDSFSNKTADSLARAKAAVAAGRGSELGSYTDVNQGEVSQARTSAAAYVSFFDPAGPALMQRNATAVKAPLLWVVGNGDQGAQAVAKGGKIVRVPGGHGKTPENGAGEVVRWLQSL